MVNARRSPVFLLLLFSLFGCLIQIHGGRPFGTGDSASVPGTLVKNTMLANAGSFVAVGGGQGASKAKPLIGAAAVAAGAAAGAGAVFGRSNNAAAAVSSSSDLATALALGAAILACI